MRKENHCEQWDDKNCRNDKGFHAAMIKTLQQNTLETNKNIESLSKEIESLNKETNTMKKQMETLEPQSLVPEVRVQRIISVVKQLVNWKKNENWQSKQQREDNN